MITLKLLSVDWDFCFPVNLLTDWGTLDENVFALDLIWNMRKTYMLREENNNRLKFIPIDEAFADYSLIPTPFIEHAGIAESHSAAFEYFSNIIEEKCPDKVLIYNYDLHHDVWPYKVSYRDKRWFDDIEPGDYVQAQNWLRALVEENLEINFKITQVVPTWAEWQGHSIGAYKDEKHIKDLPENVEYKRKVAGTFTFPWSSVDSFFICRSGSWVPPSLDKEFLKLTKKFLLKISSIDNIIQYCRGEYCPLVPRR